MNFFNITNNIIDINIIVNVSIGVVIGLSSAHLISKGITSFLQKTFPWIVLKLVHKFQPVRLILGATTDLSKPYSTETVELPKHITDEFGKSGFNQRQPVKMYLLIQPEKLRLPFLYSKYSPTVIINWYDITNTICTLRHREIGHNLRRIAEFTLKIERPQQIEVVMNTKEDWEKVRDYEIKIPLIVSNQTTLHKLIINPSK